MFGWFRPKCPLDTGEKVWIERRMLWLADRFGIERLRAATVVLPTAEFFPEPYEKDVEGAERGFAKVCRFMGVDPDSVRLEIVDDETIPGAAGLYLTQKRSRIAVARSQLEDLTKLLATVAHELAHELLLKGGHLDTDWPDHEQITDLLPVFLGVGLFGANATVATSSYSDGPMHYFTGSRQGYLSSISLGYALALFAYARGERKPTWAMYLRRDARTTMRAGLRFLFKTNDTLFHPNSFGAPRTQPSIPELLTALEHSSPSVRLGALRDAGEIEAKSPELLAAVEKCLQDRDSGVRKVAIQTLGCFGSAAAHALPLLIDVAWYGSSELRIAACTALGAIRCEPKLVVPALALVLGDNLSEQTAAAANALAEFGAEANSVAPKLLDALDAAGSVNDEARMKALLNALRATGHDVPSVVKTYFAERDAEVKRRVLAVWREMNSA